MNIKKILSDLGIEKLNEGTSTGSKWIKSTGTEIESYSPVDGKLIAAVKQTSAKEYANYGIFGQS